MSELAPKIAEENPWGRRLRWFILISLLLHLLFLFSYGWITNFQFLKVKPVKSNRDKEVVFEVVETPEQKPEPPPEKARLYSDKNLRAKNPRRTEKRADIPFQKGEEEASLMTQRPPITPSEKKPVQPRAEKTEESLPELNREENYITPPKTSFSRDVLLGKSPAKPQSQTKPRADSREFSVDDLGGFAFNTYNWNFAPYLLYLKKRIEQHIFPPPAFTRMGIIEGRTVLRFLISRDGKLQDIQILTYEGHVSLMKTSVNAVNSSAPFRPLPRDFPEEFLEVTGTFVYKIYRQ